MTRRGHPISGDFAHTSLVEPRPRVELGTYALRMRSTLLKETVHYQGLCTPGRSGGCRCPAPVPRRLSLSPLFITGRLARNQKAETARFLHACTVVTSGTRRDNRKDKLMANFLTLQELEQSLVVLAIDEPAAFAFSPCLVAEVCEPWQWRLEKLTSPGITINTLRRWCPQSTGPRCAGSSPEVTTAYCVVNNGRLN